LVDYVAHSWLNLHPCSWIHYPLPHICTFAWIWLDLVTFGLHTPLVTTRLVPPLWFPFGCRLPCVVALRWLVVGCRLRLLRLRYWIAVVRLDCVVGWIALPLRWVDLRYLVVDLIPLYVGYVTRLVGLPLYPLDSGFTLLHTVVQDTHTYITLHTFGLVGWLPLRLLHTRPTPLVTHSYSLPLVLFTGWLRLLVAPLDLHCPHSWIYVPRCRFGVVCNLTFDWLRCCPLYVAVTLHTHVTLVYPTHTGWIYPLDWLFTHTRVTPPLPHSWIVPWVAPGCPFTHPVPLGFTGFAVLRLRCYSSVGLHWLDFGWLFTLLPFGFGLPVTFGWLYTLPTHTRTHTLWIPRLLPTHSLHTPHLYTFATTTALPALGPYTHTHTQVVFTHLARIAQDPSHTYILHVATPLHTGYIWLHTGWIATHTFYIRLLVTPLWLLFPYPTFPYVGVVTLLPGIALVICGLPHTFTTWIALYI